MSESVVFELKLQIQHLQEKVTFLAGGSNGAELAGALMERDEELERTRRKVKEVETKLFQLGEGAKRVDAKRRELARQCEHQGIRMEAMETELRRQIELSSDLRSQISETKEELNVTESTLGKTRADMASAEDAARETLAAARDETSQLQTILEGQRHKIKDLEAANTGLEETVATKNEEIKSVEQRKKDITIRGRDLKMQLEKQLKTKHDEMETMKGQRETLEHENAKYRRRLDEEKQKSLEQDSKYTALARECGSVKASLEAAQAEIASAAKELSAVRENKKEVDETLLAKDKENIQLTAKLEGMVQEMARLKHRAKREVTELRDRMNEELGRHKELEATLQDQMRRQEDDNTVMVDAMAEEKAGLERKLEAARAECARLAEEGSSLKKEALVKAKKTEATSKSEARWRARAEETLAAANVENRELKAELDRFRNQAMELSAMQAENKELKGRIERQETYHKRKMEKEKRQRARSLTRTISSAGGGSSSSSVRETAGRAPSQLLPLPPAMSDSGSTSDAQQQRQQQRNKDEPTTESTMSRVSRPTTSSSNRRSATRSPVGTKRPSVIIKPPTPKANADNVACRAGVRRGRQDSQDGGCTPTLSPYQPPVSPDDTTTSSPDRPSPSNVSGIRATTSATARGSTPAAGVSYNKHGKHFFSTPPSVASAEAAAAPAAPAPTPAAAMPTPSPVAVATAAAVEAPTSDDKENGGRPAGPRRSSPALSSGEAPTSKSGRSKRSNAGVGAGAENIGAPKYVDDVSSSSCSSGDGRGSGGKGVASKGAKARGRGLGVSAHGNRATSTTPAQNGGAKGKGGGSVGSGTRGGSLESRKIRSVTRSTASSRASGGDNSTTRYPSRGRRSLVDKASSSRSLGEGMQSRASLGWR